MARQGETRYVKSESVPDKDWQDIERAYKNASHVCYNGKWWLVQAINTTIASDGRRARATLIETNRP